MVLQKQLAELGPVAEQAREAQQEAGLEDGIGLQVVFESFPEIELAFESLARERSGIELLNIRRQDQTTFATVFVPDGQLDHFEKAIRDYLERRTDRNGQPQDRRRLIDAIRAIRSASLRALWTDDDDVFPSSDTKVFWWEIWLPVRSDRNVVVDSFCDLAEGAGIRVASGRIEFPERTVLLAYTSLERMNRSMLILNSIAELRRAKETAEFFDSKEVTEQGEWLNEALERLRFSPAGAEVPHVCILDTGVNRGHPLIAPALAGADLHTIDPAWNVDDEHGHGTSMAGLALFGDIAHLLESDAPEQLVHRLESVKLMRDDGGNGYDPQHHGYLTIQAVARPEITAPSRQRLYGMMVTARDNRDRGRPSAWSAALDRLASDADAQGETPRLFVISGGNIDDPNAWAQHPSSNATDGIHDPAQSWNVLTIGAFTELVSIAGEDTEDYKPIAPEGGLSPFSSTSATWQGHWPLKPDIVFEGVMRRRMRSAQLGCRASVC